MPARRHGATQAAADVVNRIGPARTDTHNEAVIRAGSLGISSLVCLPNNGADGVTETQQPLPGPFWRMYSPRIRPAHLHKHIISPHPRGGVGTT
ncbi:hypothetical protein [Streptomyces sp. ME19-01-6]|uniref:hypothetical protein n=1 Tax=Streptomyces sp. ME19-01-6 TaxID=3028686 RepID=UPI0029A6FF12|nr:hypothetical protein [Streptomyces sp. ME19-01-6]MDX3225276.1 hypothetical protein [Streptomyces sp. ME19-01-6]